MLYHWTSFYQTLFDADTEVPLARIANANSEHPALENEDDEIAWRLTLLHCDYFALKMPIPTARNPRLAECRRLFDDCDITILSPTILMHLRQLNLDQREVHISIWVWELAELVQQRLISADSGQLYLEIQEKFPNHFRAWPAVLKQLSMQRSEVDNAICSAFVFKIFQFLIDHTCKTVFHEASRKRNISKLKHIEAQIANVNYTQPNEIQAHLKQLRKDALVKSTQKIF